jgi:ribonuclease P protein component
VHYQRNSTGGSRVVVCPGRGFANAPTRNRQRRLIREAYRLLKHRIAPGYDLLLQVRPRPRELGVQAAGGVLAGLLGNAGLLRRG